MGMCPGAVTQMSLSVQGGGEEAKQRYSVRETGCGKHVSKTRKISNLKFSPFLSSSGYDNNVTRFVLRDLKTAQRYSRTLAVSDVTPCRLFNPLTTNDLYI